MVVGNFLKHAANHSPDDQLFFYRDKSQREVDVLRVLADLHVEAYEVKAAQTFQSSFFANLDYLRGLLPERITRTCVLYDGDQQNPQPFNGFVNFREAPAV